MRRRRGYIFKQKEPGELKRLLKLAAGLESVEEFEWKAGIKIVTIFLCRFD